MGEIEELSAGKSFVKIRGLAFLRLRLVLGCLAAACGVPRECGSYQTD